jgi:anti-sigma factor RsiW
VSATNDLACRELVELITTYLDGSIDAADRTRMDGHMAGCPGCMRAMDQFRETIRVTGTLTEDEVAAPEREAIRSVFRTWKSDSS